jgi:2',3'-cyclic-nucleotide 2'-phosphodiesterase (5'-nucleotidase family)
MTLLVVRGYAAACIAALLFSACSAAQQSTRSGPSGSAAFTLSVIGTNDVHGGIVPVAARGGLALLGGYIDNLRSARSADGGEVLLLDGGDMFQGTLESNLTEGAAVVDAYRALGYAAVTIGNHEFDFGPAGRLQIPVAPTDDPQGALKARAAQASYPFVSANLIDESTGRPIAWKNVSPSVILERAGIKIGLVGVITTEAFRMTMLTNTRGLRIAPLVPAIVEQARALRARGATIIIVLAHAGGRCRTFDPPTDLSTCEPGEIFDVAKALPAGMVDMIVAGHTHSTIANIVNGIPVIESVNTGRMFGRVDLTIHRATGRVTGAKMFPPRHVCEREDPVAHTCEPDVPQTSWVPAAYEGRPVLPDAKVAAAIAPAIAQVATLKATSLGVVLDTPLEIGPTGESPLGNLFTDVMRTTSGADLAINNTRGGLRVPLPAGPLTYGSLYMTFPFDNRVVKIPLNGAELRKFALNTVTGSLREPGVSGMRVRLTCSSGTLNAELFRLNGRPIRDDERFTVATSSFLAQGGDDVFKPVLPAGGWPIPDDAPLMRDTVADWLRQRGGHLSRTDLIDTANPRWIQPAQRCGG